jgi:hypothetical protein
MDHAPTGEMKFDGEGTGVFISHEDALLYYAALHTVIMGRHDPISHAQVEQLMALLREAQDDTIGVVQVLKPFGDCRVAAAVLDPLVRV